LSEGRPELAPEAALLCSALEALSREADALGFEGLAGEARRAAEPLEAGEIRVVVLGQFKRGKSSVLNALLGRAILPTGVVPLTTVPTFLRTGRPARATVRFADGREADVDLEALDSYVTERGNPGNEKGVDRVEVTVPARHLGDGLVLVDTPGIGSAERGATGRAFGFLPRVDAGLVVLSADPPIGELELELVKSAARLTPHLFFVFNKIDLHPEESWREALDYCRLRLAEALDLRAGDLTLFPLSARRALDGAEEGQDGSSDGDRLEDLGRMLRHLGAERGEEIARDVATRRLSRLAAEGLGLVDLEEAALRTPAEELEQRMATLRDRMLELDHFLDEMPALSRSAAERAVAVAGRSLEAHGESLVPELAARIEHRAQEAGRGNRALAREVREVASDLVSREFDAWQEEEGRRISETFRADLGRLAGRLDEELAGVRKWVAERFAIELPPLVPARELAESRDFYYRVEGISQHRMLDAPRFWLPRPLFRRWLARRAERLGREDVMRNAGRLRGDLQYRYHDTARAFSAQLVEHARTARASLQGALGRALEQRRRGERETGAQIERLHAARSRMRDLSKLASAVP